MRLAFVCNLYPPYVVGGNELLCDDVVRALRARGHEVAVLCGRGRELPEGVSGELEIDLDRKADTFLGGRRPSPWQAVKLHLFSPSSHSATRRWLARVRPDLTVVWNLYMASLAPLVAARAHGAPVVVHAFDKWLYYGLRDLVPLLNPVQPWKRSGLRCAARAVQPLLRRRVQPLRLIAVSEFMRDFYARAGFDATGIAVERLGVETARFAESRGADPDPSRELRLLFVGALWEGKGPQTAIRALGRCRRAGVAAELDLCGEGAPSFEQWLRRIAAEEGVGRWVRFRGRVPRSSVPGLCASHDVLVFPSEWDEPFAAVPLEAMSCGMAVVATTAGGTPEAVTDGVTGLLVPPCDAEALAAAVRRLADDRALLSRLGRAAAAVVRERFEFDDYVDRLVARYAALASAPR